MEQNEVLQSRPAPNITGKQLVVFVAVLGFIYFLERGSLSINTKHVHLGYRGSELDNNVNEENEASD